METLKIKFWEGKQKSFKEVSLSLLPPGVSWIQNIGEKKYIDLYNLGRFVFEIERHLNLNEKGKARKNVLNLTRVEIPLVSQQSEKNLKEISEILKGIFVLLYNQSIEFSFSLNEFKQKEHKQKVELDFKNKDAILLFSGGLDSILGLEYCRRKYKNGLLVYLSQKKRMGKVIDSIRNDLPKGFNIIEMDGPQISRGYFANTAGFFYCLSSSIFSDINSKPLIISECGVTSYQVKFGPLNSITYTTHPYIIDSVKRIFNIISGKNLDIIQPFNDYTKSEMVAEYGVQKVIEKSFSCLNSNPCVKGMSIIQNCGECYACIIRRLAILLVMDDPTKYIQREVFSLDKEEILPLLEFCYVLLKDFDLLDYPQKEKIIKYNKKNLFERFSIDTFAAIYKISNTANVPDYIKDYLKNIDKKILEARIKKIEESYKNNPNK